MTTFVIAFGLVLLAMTAMGVGVLVLGRPLRGGCHASGSDCALGGRCRSAETLCEGGGDAGR